MERVSQSQLIGKQRKGSGIYVFFFNIMMMMMKMNKAPSPCLQGASAPISV